MLSETDLTENIYTIFLAGEGTTAYTLAWMLYYLQKHPAVFSLARADADAAVGSDHVPASYEQLNQSNFMDACINESLRLSPVAPFIGSEANFDMQLADVSVPKGTLIFLLPRIGSVDKRNFLHAAKFLAERWLEAVRLESNREIAIPFGSGPRLCPGRFLAMEEMNMALPMLVKNFDIARIGTTEGKDIQERLRFRMAPDGLRFRLLRRANGA